MYSVETRNLFELLEGGSAVKKPVVRKKAPVVPVASEGAESRTRVTKKGGPTKTRRRPTTGGDGARRVERKEKDKEGREPREGRRKPKREFDRKSGTGRPGTEKKRGGGGKGTWGKPGAEIADLADGVEKVKEETPERAEGPADEEVEKEAPTVSLDEFEKARKAKAARLAAPRVTRKVEGDFSNLKKVSRDDAAENPFAGAQQKKQKKQKVNRKKGAVSADKVFKFEFADNDEPRVDRGRGRGRGGKGAEKARKPRGGNGGKKSVDLSDSSFPSLAGGR